LTLRSFAAATENVLLCELKAERELEIKARFLFPNETGYGSDKTALFHRHLMAKTCGNNPPGEYREDRLPLMKGWRVFSGTVDQETKLAFAGRFLCTPSSLTMPVSSGRPDWSSQAEVPSLSMAAGETMW
jgi:hypothetical protein